MGAAPAPAADERPARAGKSDADALTAWLIGWLSDRLNLPAAAIDASRGFAEMGLDSLGSTELAFELGRQIGTDLPETIAYDHPTVFRFISHIVPGAGPAPAHHVTNPRKRTAHFHHHPANPRDPTPT